jgi:ribosome-associated translation inhibitor RaiA/cold shock CspA family protein
MQTPLQIAWTHLEPSDFIRARVEREVEALERRFGRIMSCTVQIEGRSHRQHKGGLHALRVHLHLPGGVDINATRNPPEDHAHEDAYVAIRDVFDALRRQLRERVRERREAPKQPDLQPHGLVARLAPAQDHGFIRADDGREIYFHRNSVLTGFDRLRVGAEVHFAEEEGRDGPQASSVRAYGVATRDD